MSIPSISERLKKLEENGIIEGYFAKLNKKSFGYDIMAYILVVMESSKHYKTLGEGSHLLKAVTGNTESLEKLLGDIQSWPGVMATKTTFVLSTIKETTILDIKQ